MQEHRMMPFNIFDMYFTCTFLKNDLTIM